MVKKSTVTQELVNIFPPWSKIRTDDQSVGFFFFNALAEPIEDMDRQLHHMQKNAFLSTVNLHEIDLTYKVELPSTFEFEMDYSDPTEPVAIAPTVEGYVDGIGYINVELAENEDVKSFWYDSVPSRISIGETVSGVARRPIYSKIAYQFPWSGVLKHYLADHPQNGGPFYIMLKAGIQYINKDSRNEITRGRVHLKGITRKGTEEEETIVFPWNQRQRTSKEWNQLTEINLYDVENTVNLTVYQYEHRENYTDDTSPDCTHWSFYNNRWNDNKKKIDELWTISNISPNTGKLARVGLITDEWEQAVLGFSDSEVKEYWTLCDPSGNEITEPKDIAIEPFTNRGWVVTNARKLYCYSLDDTMPASGLWLKTRTSGCETQLESEKYILEGGDFNIEVVHARPLKEILRYRLSYQKPNTNTRIGINGDLYTETYDDNLWVYPERLQRQIRAPISFTPDTLGVYLFILETEFIDGTEEEYRLLVDHGHCKLPLREINFANQWNSAGLANILQCYFDSDQNFWILTDNLIADEDHVKINLYTDVMLIDYDNKVLYFKEDYTDIKITT